MKELLALLVSKIVKNPKDVKVEETAGPGGEVLMNLTVNPEDAGLVIGKGGKVIKSLRSILRVKAILENKKVNILLKDQN